MAQETFGPYRLVALLGAGGMGEVWRAVDASQDDRVVAFKVLLAHLSGDPDFARRFRREAKLAAGLTCPNIIPIHKYGEIDDRLYIDMPLIHGCDLGALIESDGPLPPDRAVRTAPSSPRPHRDCGGGEDRLDRRTILDHFRQRGQDHPHLGPGHPRQSLSAAAARASCGISAASG